MAEGFSHVGTLSVPRESLRSVCFDIWEVRHDAEGAVHREHVWHGHDDEDARVEFLLRADTLTGRPGEVEFLELTQSVASLLLMATAAPADGGPRNRG